MHTVNTGTIAELTVQTPDGHVAYGGDARIDGVPGTAAPIAVEFLDAAGSVCGSLLPTGNVVDRVAGVDVTLIDNGMPVVVLEAASVGRTGYEPRDVLDKDMELKARLEEIRLEAGRLMGLGRRLVQGRAQDGARGAAGARVGMSAPAASSPTNAMPPSASLPP